MKIDKKSSLFQLVNGVEQPPTDSVLWYINRFLAVHPYAGVYTVEDTEHVSRTKDVRKKNFYPSGDTMKCERLLYWERDPEYAPLLQEKPDPHLQCIFKVGSALHAMIQAWFWAWNGLDGFPRCVQNEMPLLDEGLHIGGYIDSVLIFPGTSFKIPIEIKTTNSNTFNRLSSPLAYHKLQVGCYIMELDAPFGIVLYINKDTQEFKEFKVEPFDMSPVLRRWGNVRAAVDAQDMSRLEYGCSSLKQWEKCPAHSWCRNAGDFKGINLYG